MNYRSVCVAVFATGTYALNFTAGADPAIHSANFQIK